MARASLIPQVRGTLHTSVGDPRDSRRFGVIAFPEPVAPSEQAIMESAQYEDSDLASFERMMRNNRAAGF